MDRSVDQVALFVNRKRHPTEGTGHPVDELPTIHLAGTQPSVNAGGGELGKRSVGLTNSQRTEPLVGLLGSSHNHLAVFVSTSQLACNRVAFGISRNRKLTEYLNNLTRGLAFQSAKCIPECASTKPLCPGSVNFLGGNVCRFSCYTTTGKQVTDRNRTRGESDERISNTRGNPRKGGAIKHHLTDAPHVRFLRCLPPIGVHLLTDNKRTHLSAGPRIVTGQPINRLDCSFDSLGSLYRSLSDP